MATGFPSDVAKACQGCRCYDESTLNYDVTDKQRLCQTCALDRTCTGNKSKRYWSCDIHEKTVRFFCESHGAEACQSCVTVSHRQDCIVVDIDSEIEKRKADIFNLKRKAKDKSFTLSRLSNTIKDFRKVGTSHLASLEREVNSFVNDEIRKSAEKEKDDVKLVDEQADMEIQKINNTREEKKRAVQEEAGKRNQLFESRRHELLSDVENTTRAYNTKMEELFDSLSIASKQLADHLVDVEEMLENDKKLFKDAKQVLTSVTKILSGVLYHEDNRDAEKTLLVVKRVRFYKPETPISSAPEHWKIDGYPTKWNPLKQISFPDDIRVNRIYGCLCEGKIAVRCSKEKNIRVLNIDTGQAPVVVENTGSSGVATCVPLDNGTVVCGKELVECTGSTLVDCISIYDTTDWRLVRNVSIPRNTAGRFTRVYADVDHHGMIIATEFFQSSLYIIDPTDGVIRDCVAVQGWVMRGRAMSLSTGDFVIKVVKRSESKRSELICRAIRIAVVNRLGDVTKVIWNECWGTDLRFFIDPTFANLYVIYENGRDHVLDEVSRSGGVTGKQIAQFPAGPEWHKVGRITPSGLLVCCNGEKLFVFKKTISW